MATSPVSTGAPSCASVTGKIIKFPVRKIRYDPEITPEEWEHRHLAAALHRIERLKHLLVIEKSTASFWENMLKSRVESEARATAAAKREMA